MAFINKIKNGDSGLVVRTILNLAIDAVNGFATTISGWTTRIEDVEYRQNARVIATLSGEQDGNNKHFTTREKYIANSSKLYVDGLRLFNKLNYLEKDSNSFDFIDHVPEGDQQVVFEILIEK